MRVLLVNTHSTLNTGDMGIVQAQIRLIRNFCPEAVISLTSRTPDHDRDFYDRQEIRVFPPLFIAPSVYIGWKKKVIEFLKSFLNWGNKISLIQEMKRSDLIISSGGGYFYSNRTFIPGPMFFQNIVHVLIPLLIKKPVIFFPQSVGPLHNAAAKKILKHTLASKHMVKFFAREPLSYDYLQRLYGNERKKPDLELCPDVTFDLFDERSLSKQEHRLDLPKPIMAITLREWDFPYSRSRGERRENYLSSLIRVSQEFLKKWEGSLLILPQVRGPGSFEDDRIISREFFERMNPSVPENRLNYLDLPDRVSPSYVASILAQTDIVLATRLHSAILALISNVPVVTLMYQPKSLGVMKMLRIDHLNVDMSEIDSVSLFKKVDEILSYPESVKEIIRKSVEKTVMDLRQKMGQTLSRTF